MCGFKYNTDTSSCFTVTVAFGELTGKHLWDFTDHRMASFSMICWKGRALTADKKRKNSFWWYNLRSGSIFVSLVDLSRGRAKRTVEITINGVKLKNF